jgi:outer membrane protein assembly factor BamD
VQRRPFITAVATVCLLVSACSKPPPTFEEAAPADELYEEGLETLTGRRLLLLIPYVNYDKAIETFQAIIDNYPYSDYATLAELRIADAYFEDGRYEESLTYYRDFSDLHPQHEKVPYTIFRSALCQERRVKSPIRDQTATREALTYLDRLLAQHPHSDYTADAEALWRELRTRLANNVLEIADFYRDRGEFESAAKRYRTVLNEFPGLGLDATALYQLGVCYSKMNRREEAVRIFQAVVENYQESDVAGDARDRIASLE